MSFTHGFPLPIAMLCCYFFLVWKPDWFLFSQNIWSVAISHFQHNIFYLGKGDSSSQVAPAIAELGAWEGEPHSTPFPLGLAANANLRKVQGLFSSFCFFSQIVTLSSWSLLRDSTFYTFSVVTLIVVSALRRLCGAKMCWHSQWIDLARLRWECLPHGRENSKSPEGNSSKTPPRKISPGFDGAWQLQTCI